MILDKQWHIDVGRSAVARVAIILAQRLEAKSYPGITDQWGVI